MITGKLFTIPDLSITMPVLHSAMTNPACSLAVGAMEWFEKIKPIGLAFQDITERTRLISESFGKTWKITNAGLAFTGLKGLGYPFWDNQEEFEQSERRIYTKERKIYVPDKNLEPIEIKIRKRGNRTGSVPNVPAMQATEKYFYDFVKEQERYLQDFTRKQIMFFILEKMRDLGIEEYFHHTHFKKIYAKCRDVNHRAGNHHGQKDKPDLIMQVLAQIR